MNVGLIHLPVLQLNCAAQKSIERLTVSDQLQHVL
jgi:hypothetical protein